MLRIDKWPNSREWCPRLWPGQTHARIRCVSSRSHRSRNCHIQARSNLDSTVVEESLPDWTVTAGAGRPGTQRAR